MIKKLKIIVLSENISKKTDLKPEHGLSLYIEADDEKLLFDTGASDVFKRNAQKLEIDLNQVDKVILSHGHYDHAGGLKYFNNKEIIVHEEIVYPKYKYLDNKYQHIGFDYFQADKTVKIKDNLKLSEDIFILADFEKNIPDNYFYIKKNDEYLPDLFLDELALSMQTEKGLIIITGCSHSGIINIIEKALLINKTNKIYGLFGGFHLSKLSEEENLKIARQINEYQISNIGISHCTGNKLAKNLIADNVFNFNVGDVFSL